jgi:phage pi2 protein 07
MQNDPSLDPKYLGKISSDFVKLSEHLKEASYHIRKRGFSEFPIFPVSKVDVPIGQILYEIDQFGNQWNYYASFMEEFVDRKLIEEAEAFKAAFKDPDEYCCLFIVDREFTNFVFIPYPED